MDGSNKTLQERIIEEYNKEYNNLKIYFLVHKDEIIDASKNFSKKKIWRYLYENDEFSGSYSSFLCYFKKYIEISEKRALKNKEVSLPVKRKVRLVRHFPRRIQPQKTD